MIEWQPALEQHSGGIVGNAGPPSRSNLPVVPRDAGVAGSGIVGGAAASNQVHPPRNDVAAIPLPPEDFYLSIILSNRSSSFNPVLTERMGLFIQPRMEKSIFAWHAS